MTTHTDVDIHIDPCCPWAWLTSRWLAEVETVRPVRVRTRLFVLAEINGAEGQDERIARIYRASEVALRVLVAARRAGGDQALARAYAALGEAHHERGEALDDPAVLAGALRAAGVAPGLADSARTDPTIAEELLAEHRAIAGRGAFGVPTLVVGDAPPTFGPIVDRRLDAARAGELWDRVVWLLDEGSFCELKRDRPQRPRTGRHRDRATAA